MVVDIACADDPAIVTLDNPRQPCRAR